MKCLKGYISYNISKYYMKRYYCEFKNCKCDKFVSQSRICYKCNHANIWHSKKKKENLKCFDRPPSDGEVQFMSPRKNAHKPKYVSDVIFGQVHIFKPLPLAPAIEVANPCFCPEITLLPA